MRKLLLILCLAMTMSAFAQSGTTYRVKMSFEKNGAPQTLYATFDDNATSRALVAMMPMTLPMLNLYGDEMCYRFTGNPLPTDDVQYYLHTKGEIFYWPPGPSFVIRYIETDEYLNIQHIGQVESGVDVFNSIGDTNVTFELVGTTALDEVSASDADVPAYTISGHQAPKGYKGVVIQNGKKELR